LAGLFSPVRASSRNLRNQNKNKILGFCAVSGCLLAVWQRMTPLLPSGCCPSLPPQGPLARAGLSDCAKNSVRCRPLRDSSPGQGDPGLTSWANEWRPCGTGAVRLPRGCTVSAELVAKPFFRPFRGWLFSINWIPTACAVGCILSPLRGCRTLVLLLGSVARSPLHGCAAPLSGGNIRT
jgi:hypothetical protein